MAKKLKKVALFVLMYGIIFLFGFRSGEIYYRITRRAITNPPSPEAFSAPKTRMFILVEEYSRDGNKEVGMEYVSEKDPRILIFLNRKLRPLLKLRKIKIYSSKGDRIY